MTALNPSHPNLPTKYKLSFLTQLCRDLIHKAFSLMPKGHLLLVEPSGLTLTFGEAHSSTQAAIHIANEEQFYWRLVQAGPIGFAEAYMDQHWDSPDLKAVFHWFLENAEASPIFDESSNQVWWLDWLKGLNRFKHLLKDNSLLGSRQNIQAHYDLSNDFFKTFLDPTMSYSSAVFENFDESLEAAQTRKIDLLCQKLRLTPSDHLLEIGTGWGGLAIHAVKHYGCTITTTTISNEQFELAKQRFEAEGVASKIHLIQKDYRLLQGQFDKLVSVEMLEAVGDKHYESFFRQCNQLLKPNGLAAIQVITCPDSRYETLRQGVDFIQKYIFPGSLIPSLGRLQLAMARTGSLGLHELQDFGSSYALTLSRWNEAFLNQLEDVKNLGFSERFIRMWHYYFKYCQVGFEARHLSVVQMLLTKPNNSLLMERFS